MTALTSFWPKVPLTFFITVATARSFGPPASRPVYQAARAKPPQPMMLPMYERTQLLATSSMLTRPSYSAAGTAAELPVKSWPPEQRMSSRLTGKSAAKMNFWIPGFSLAMPGTLPAIIVESRPPNPT
jgi:hypothetical protein